MVGISITFCFPSLKTTSKASPVADFLIVVAFSKSSSGKTSAFNEQQEKKRKFENLKKPPKKIK